MHAVFSTPRESKTALHLDKIEAAHEMKLSSTMLIRYVGIGSLS
jgi:hypothetical protein